MMSRHTIQRSLVFEAVNKLQCHATAEEIYEAIITEHPSMSRATVYRNLKLLSKIGDIRKIEISGGADRFDPLCHDHYHVKCEKCGRVFDVAMEYISGLERIYGMTADLFSTDTIYLFRGVCPNCQESPKLHNC